MSISWITEKARLEKLAHQFDKSIKLYTKDNWLCRVLAWKLSILTTIFTLGFKRYDKEKFLTKYATVIGNFLFIPKEWESWQVESILPHEGRHVVQLRYLGFFLHPLAGIPLGLAIYGLFPLPIGLAYGRFWMELDAEKASWKYRLEKDLATPLSIRFRAENFAETLASWDYLKTWPRKWACNKFLKEANRAIEKYYAS